MRSRQKDADLLKIPQQGRGATWNRNSLAASQPGHFNIKCYSKGSKTPSVLPLGLARGEGQLGD